MNRGLNRENPYILIVMIAEKKQIIRGGVKGKGNQKEREREGKDDGALKA